MKKYILAALIMWFATGIQAQNQTATDSAKSEIAAVPHRIIFQLTTDDTMAHKALMKQIRNITSVAPGTQIEVVCHGPGLNMLVASRTRVHESIIKLAGPDITFIACEFSMKERNVTREMIISEAGYVKAGIVEIVSKQEQGWSYIKAGF